MDENQVRGKIYNIVVNSDALFGGNSIEYDNKLIEFGLDSIGVIDIIVSLEEEFGFEFDVNELVLDNFSTINNIIDLVINKLQN